MEVIPTTVESATAAVATDQPSEDMTSENNTSKFLDDDPYICVRQRKEQFQKMDVPLAASMNKDTSIAQPQYSNNQPIKSSSKSSIGSVTSTSGMSTAKPVVKPASNFSSIDHRSGLSKSFGGKGLTLMRVCI